MAADPATVELGQAIRDARIRKGIRQSDLARMLEIPVKQLRDIEIGRYRPTPDLLDRILVRLGPPGPEEPVS